MFVLCAVRLDLLSGDLLGVCVVVQCCVWGFDGVWCIWYMVYG